MLLGKSNQLILCQLFQLLLLVFKKRRVILGFLNDILHLFVSMSCLAAFWRFWCTFCRRALSINVCFSGSLLLHTGRVFVFNIIITSSDFAILSLPRIDVVIIWSTQLFNLVTILTVKARLAFLDSLWFIARLLWDRFWCLFAQIYCLCEIAICWLHFGTHVRCSVPAIRTATSWIGLSCSRLFFRFLVVDNLLGLFLCSTLAFRIGWLI